MCVAQKAAELAKRFGVEEERAYTAGILHDIMKDIPKPEQLKIIEKSGILLSNIEQQEPKLLHAIAGAAYLQDCLQLTDMEIIRAVRYHTTARAGMSLLEKVLYIADFISEDRTFAGVEALREEAEAGLDEAMLACTRFTILELAEADCAIHLDSVAAYNECILNDTKSFHRHHT